MICYNGPTMKNKRTAHERIVRIPGLMGGKPVIKGHRIPVELVLEHLAYDPDLNKLFDAFPRLTIEDVKACLAYAHKLVENETLEPQHAHL